MQCTVPSFNFKMDQVQVLTYLAEYHRFSTPPSIWAIIVDILWTAAQRLPVLGAYGREEMMAIALWLDLTLALFLSR